MNDKVFFLMKNSFCRYFLFLETVMWGSEPVVWGSQLLMWGLEPLMWGSEVSFANIGGQKCGVHGWLLNN